MVEYAPQAAGRLRRIRASAHLVGRGSFETMDCEVAEKIEGWSELAAHIRNAMRFFAKMRRSVRVSGCCVVSVIRGPQFGLRSVYLHNYPEATSFYAGKAAGPCFEEEHWAGSC